MKYLKNFLLELPPLLAGTILTLSLVGWELGIFLSVLVAVGIYVSAFYFCVILFNILPEKIEETELLDQLNEINKIEPDEQFTTESNPHANESPYSYIVGSKKFICIEPFYLFGIWIKKNDELEISFKESDDCLLIYIHLGLDLNVPLKKINSLITLEYIKEIQ